MNKCHWKETNCALKVKEIRWIQEGSARPSSSDWMLIFKVIHSTLYRFNSFWLFIEGKYLSCWDVEPPRQAVTIDPSIHGLYLLVHDTLNISENLSEVSWSNKKRWNKRVSIQGAWTCPTHPSSPCGDHPRWIKTRGSCLLTVRNKRLHGFHGRPDIQ